MKFIATKLQGLWLICPTPSVDPRGTFARTFCRDEFGAMNFRIDFHQHSLSVSTHRHTVRGLHFQTSPHQEIKLVTCVRGAIWDVAVDLRRNSPTYLQWVATVLSSENGHHFYIPEGFAHGFQSLTDDAAVSYMISTPYVEHAACGVRYDHPAIDISWPARPTIISDRDLAWPNQNLDIDLAPEEPLV